MQETAPEADFIGFEDPFALFNLWMDDAEAAEPADANAMTVATVDKNGLPNARILLLKDVSKGGFVFFTNYNSTKGKELLSSKKTALCFYWKSLMRQVRIRGPVVEVESAEADVYFASRPRGSQIGAWASAQSEPLESRAKLLERVKSFEEKFQDQDVPRPPHWSGFRLIPVEMEFWQNGEFRLHDRVRFEREKIEDPWTRNRLNP